MFAVVSVVNRCFLSQSFQQNKQPEILSRGLSTTRCLAICLLKSNQIFLCFYSQFALTVILNERREKMEVSEVGCVDGGQRRVIQFIHSLKSLFLNFFSPFLLRDACPKGWIKLHCDRQGFHGTHPFCCCTPYWFSGPRLHWLLNDSSVQPLWLLWRILKSSTMKSSDVISHCHCVLPECP